MLRDLVNRLARAIISVLDDVVASTDDLPAEVPDCPCCPQGGE